MSCRGGSNRSPMVAESNFSCCSQVTYVQDQVCFPINITPVATAITQDLYRLNINPLNLYVSGTILIAAAPAGRTLTVNFLLGGPTGTVIETDTLTAGAGITPNITGEICVTPRYAISS